MLYKSNKNTGNKNEKRRYIDLRDKVNAEIDLLQKELEALNEKKNEIEEQKITFSNKLATFKDQQLRKFTETINQKEREYKEIYSKNQENLDISGTEIHNLESLSMQIQISIRKYLDKLESKH